MKYLSLSAKNKIAFFKALSTKGSFFVATIMALVLMPASHPRTAHAGLFSFISDLTSDKASAKTLEVPVELNSQNMALLQAAVNVDPNPNKSDSYDPIVVDNSFVAQIGPQGTASDVEDRISTEISLYTVRSGDTLSKIAEMFGVSVNTIIWANELGKNPVIREGQMLVILPISGIKYTVSRGDTIRGIVSKYKANLEEVLEYNDLTLASILGIGDVIVIPDAEPTITDVPRIIAARTTVSTTNVVHDANGPFYPGYYIRPIDGGKKSQGLHGYNAIDLAAPVGTAIHAAAAGTVIASMTNGGWNGGYGNYVIISHKNGTQTLYAHNQKNFVSVGDAVEQGQLIAKIGMTGKSTGPHVHFEIRGAKNPF
ncbi:MAG: M23 family metallopeptidase [Patescibacteria group bacterium]